MIRIVSPVFAKELTQLATSKRMYWAKLGYVASATGIIGLMLLSGATGSMMGELLFRTWSITSFFLILLITPITTAGIISGERAANTLNLLFLTRLNAWHMAQDKALSRIAYLIYLIVLTLPILFCGLLFGGIDSSQIIAAAGYLGAMILLCAAISTLCSAVFRGFASALVVSYISILFILIAPPLLLPLTGSSDGWLAYVSPFALFSLGHARMITMNPELLDGWEVQLPVSFGLQLLATALSAWRLRAISRGETQQLRSSVKAAPPAQCGQPLLNREFKLIRSGLSRVVRGVCIFLLVSLGCLLGSFAIFARQELEDVTVFFAFFWMVVATILVAIQSSTAFTADRESGTLDILLTTRFRSAPMLNNKIAMALFRDTWLWAIPILLMAVTASLNKGSNSHWFWIIAISLFLALPPTWVGLRLIAGIRSPFTRFTSLARLFVIPLTFLAFLVIMSFQRGLFAWIPFLWTIDLVFVTLLSIRISLSAKRSSHGIGITLGVLLGITLGIPLLASVVQLGDVGMSNLIVAFSPIGGMILSAISDAKGFGLLNAVIYVLLCAVLYVRMHKNFNAIVHRQR